VDSGCLSEGLVLGDGCFDIQVQINDVFIDVVTCYVMMSRSG
jgi:hypothetical protein